MKPEFVFMACRHGSENHCKQEVAKKCAGLKFSFSKRGLLTFKVVGKAADFQAMNQLIFPRLVGASIGPIEPQSPDFWAELEQRFSESGISERAKHLHVWDRALGAGDDQLLKWIGLEKGDSDWLGDPESLTTFNEKMGLALNRRGKPGDFVFDLIRMDENQGWLGWHQVESSQQSFPGGVPKFQIPEKVVSRAYYKTREAMQWSRFPFHEGDVCVEIGSAPGGSAQALLERKLQVIGIDPAEMDPSIAEHPAFLQIKKRIVDLRKKDLADAKWLFSDSNVAPTHTLDSIEEIVNSQYLNVRGLILTFKIMQDKLLADLDRYRERIQSFGFRYVRMRQLAFNRNEICLVALKKKSELRFGRLRPRKKRTQ